ncbi:hypothetical protein M3Y94_00249300 [Aphelenchoides besseyi]|nr:hypothetical protein M3Y94_00249300 [Aphelenchoides besseyi]
MMGQQVSLYNDSSSTERPPLIPISSNSAISSMKSRLNSRKKTNVNRTAEAAETSTSTQCEDRPLNWLVIYQARRMNDFVDVSEPEKHMMLLWNQFVTQSNSRVATKGVCNILLKKFAQENATEIMTNGLDGIRHFLMHCATKYKRGLLDSTVIHESLDNLLKTVEQPIPQIPKNSPAKKRVPSTSNSPKKESQSPTKEQKSVVPKEKKSIEKNKTTSKHITSRHRNRTRSSVGIKLTRRSHTKL